MLRLGNTRNSTPQRSPQPCCIKVEGRGTASWSSSFPGRSTVLLTSSTQVHLLSDTEGERRGGKRPKNKSLTCFASMESYWQHIFCNCASKRTCPPGRSWAGTDKRFHWLERAAGWGWRLPRYFPSPARALIKLGWDRGCVTQWWWVNISGRQVRAAAPTPHLSQFLTSIICNVVTSSRGSFAWCLAHRNVSCCLYFLPQSKDSMMFQTDLSPSPLYLSVCLSASLSLSLSLGSPAHLPHLALKVPSGYPHPTKMKSLQLC